MEYRIVDGLGEELAHGTRAPEGLDQVHRKHGSGWRGEQGGVGPREEWT
jgi:hypothetical protein